MASPSGQIQKINTILFMEKDNTMHQGCVEKTEIKNTLVH